MRYFAGLKLDRLPDETTALNFRHFLEQHGLGKALFFKEVNSDPEMHQTKKGNESSATPVTLTFKSGMSISTARTSPGSFPNGLPLERSWMSTS
tara:strand:- start:2995 stop:3276 length:282 start_codon:yes stop_codon:yes gene_type:complete